MSAQEKQTTGAVATGSALRRRHSKCLAATVIAALLDHWMCDGFPTGNDSDDCDDTIFRAEAMAWQRRIDARVASLMKPNR